MNPIKSNALLDDLFTLLILGLSEYIEQGTDLSDSRRLRQAINRLSALMLINNTEVPKTIEAFIHLFEQPLYEWWPAENGLGLPIEKIIDLLPLLYDERLHSQVVDYLIETQIDNLVGKPMAQIRKELDQTPIEEMVRLARSNPSRYGNDYALARRYVIEHPYTTEADLYTQIEVLTDNSFQELLRSMFERQDTFDIDALSQEKYWICPYCGGILNWRGSQPYCVKHDVCALLSNGYQNRHSIEPHWSLMRLRPGIHARTTIPGIPEIDLFKWLQQNLCQNSSVFDEPVLYPGGDRYDIRVPFQKGKSIAIDIKDYASPYQLAHRLQEEWPQQLRHKNDSDVEWSKFYYVVPLYRVRTMPHYLKYARDIFSDAPIVSSDELQKILLQHTQNDGWK